MPSSFTLINIVSTKGGVGKSSIALAMAVHFAQKNNDALIVLADLDFSGTCLLEGLEKGIKDWPANKTKGYLNKYIETMPECATLPQSDPYLFFIPDFGNFLLTTSNVGEASIKRIKPFLDYEENTCYITKRLCSFFGDILSKIDSRNSPIIPGKQFPRLILILDNSPGIGGIARNFIDLTKGKLKDFMNCDHAGFFFQKIDLFITSPDKQDLEASRSFIMDYHERYYNDLKSNDRQILVVINLLRTLDKNETFEKSKEGINTLLRLIDKPLYLGYCKQMRWFHWNCPVSLAHSNTVGGLRRAPGYSTFFKALEEKMGASS